MTDKLEQVAARLRAAYSGGVVAPLRDALDGAYAVQTFNTLYWEAQGRRVVGRKIGLTAEAVQRQLGVDRPDFGVLFKDMQLADGGVLLVSKVLQPKAEAEIALVLREDVLNVRATPNDILAATHYAAAAIEIVDSRIADWQITFADTVADNGSAAFFVLSEAHKPLGGLDLYTCGMAMEVDGRIASIGAGAACLGHPLNAAAWLARTLAERGEPLRAGDILLTGALGPMVTLAPGAQVTAKIGGLGEVSFTFDGNH